MKIVDTHEAKPHLLNEKKDIVIPNAEKPRGKLEKYQKGSSLRATGYWKGEVKVAGNFDQFPEYIITAFREEVF